MKLFKNVALEATAMLALACAVTAHAETVDGYDPYGMSVGGPACYKVFISRDNAGNVVDRKILRETYHRCGERVVAPSNVRILRPLASVVSGPREKPTEACAPDGTVTAIGKSGTRYSTAERCVVSGTLGSI